MLRGVGMGYFRTKIADFVLRGFGIRCLRTKPTPFCADDGQGCPFTLFSPSALKLFISYGSSSDQI